MWRVRPTLIASVVGMAVLCLRPSFAGTWPPIVPGKLVYEVKPGDESITVDTFFIPDNFTIYVPGVNSHRLNWHFKVMQFGSHSTIDLCPGPQLPKRPKQPGQTAQPSFGVAGFNGYSGETGENGRDADSLFIEVSDRIERQGSLWIRTDGQTGGEGGDGGDGGVGGGSQCTPLGCSGDGGRGGDGGTGGRGGNGGNAAWVQIRYHDYETPITPACGVHCGGSSRPASAEGNSGIIVIFGVGGCGAPGGNGGYPGGGGPGRNCGFGRRDCNPGQAGAAGQSHYYDQRGKDGTCPSSVIIKN